MGSELFTTHFNMSFSPPSSCLSFGISYVSVLLTTLCLVKVKQYHPDVNKEGSNSDVMIRRIIQAYEVTKPCSTLCEQIWL